MTAVLLKEIAKAFRQSVAARTSKPEHNDRFEKLLSAPEWSALPAAVQERFSNRIAGGSIIYRGRTTHLRMNPAGWLLAQAARIIGAPLPINLSSKDRPAVVAVTDDPTSDGQVWTRLYARGAGYPQMINSTKRFTGPTGLEEHVGGGVSMSLALSVEAGALFFNSVDYFLTIFGNRVRLPRWLAPGAMQIGHHDLGAEGFAFTLMLTHPIFGLLIEQTTIFHEMEEVRP